MNKIRIDNRLQINENETYLIELTKEIKSTIIVEKNIKSKIILYGKDIDYDLVINLDENSELIINNLVKDVNTNITINLMESAKIIYNYSIISKNDCSCNFVINHLKKNTKSNLYCNGINLSNNKLFFKIDGILKKESTNSFSEQNSKIINFLNGNSKIIPNFIIDNNDIIANHSSYIGNFNEDEMFYLKSRGIKEEDVYRLLYRSVLLGRMELDFEKELFHKLLKEWGVL